jgi:hypothetical protein
MHYAEGPLDWIGPRTIHRQIKQLEARVRFQPLLDGGPGIALKIGTRLTRVSLNFVRRRAQMRQSRFI